MGPGELVTRCSKRFTDRSRRVVVLAQEEARMLNHNYIGTEHLLLGLLHEAEGVAAVALRNLGVTLETVQAQVEEIIGRGVQAPSGHIPFTPRSKTVLEASLREALALDHQYIGTEHILLGIVHEGEGVAAQIIIKLGADLNRVRQEVISLLHGYNRAAPPEPVPVRPAPARPRARHHLELSEELREVVRVAMAEAAALRHGYIGTEHLLLGLLQADGAAPRLADLVGEAVTVAAVREQIAGLADRDAAPDGDRELTPEAADALDLAECWALGAGDAEVEPPHLVMALAWAERSLALRVVTDLGVPKRAAAQAAELADGAVDATTVRAQRILAALARPDRGDPASSSAEVPAAGSS